MNCNSFQSRADCARDTFESTHYHLVSLRFERRTLAFLMVSPSFKSSISTLIMTRSDPQTLDIFLANDKMNNDQQQDQVEQMSAHQLLLSNALLLVASLAHTRFSPAGRAPAHTTHLPSHPPLDLPQLVDTPTHTRFIQTSRLHTTTLTVISLAALRCN